MHKLQSLTKDRAWQALLLSIAVHSCFIVSASAQSYSVDWSKVSGGGGAITGGVYTVSGTIGQHDAGEPMTGGNYTVTGGFWSLISVIQTPGAPQLRISRAGPAVTLYWQNVTGWNLQQNSSVTVPTGWSPSTGVTNSNGTNYLTLTSPTGRLFFHLSNP